MYIPDYLHILILFSTHLKNGKNLSFSIGTIFAHSICEFYKMKTILIGLISIGIFLNVKNRLGVPECLNLDIVETLIFHKNQQFSHGHRTDNDTLDILYT